jgi:hypothetical protein
MIILWTKMNPAPINGATRFESATEAAAFLHEVQSRQQKWDKAYYRVNNSLVVNAHDVGVIHLGKATWDVAAMPPEVGRVIATMRGTA